MTSARRLSRRDFLRATAAGAVGLAGAQLIGCGDGDGTPSPTATSSTATAAATATPGALGWRKLAPAGMLPPARRDHSLTTDGERLVVYGGRSGGQTLDDAWAFDLTSNAWREIRADDAPPGRFGHNAVTVDRSVMIFGGQGEGGFFNDLWLLTPTLAQWAYIPTQDAPPAARYGAAAALEADGRLLVTHGFTNQGRFDDTWEFAVLDNFWTEISPQGARPIERCLVRAVWDAGRERLIMFGGQTTATPFLGDTWALTPEGWIELTPELSPSPRNFYAMVYDEAASRALLFGGNTEDGLVNDLWAFDSASNLWAQLAVAGEAPSPRAGHDATIATGGAVYLFGGSDGSSELNDLWVLSAA